MTYFKKNDMTAMTPQEYASEWSKSSEDHNNANDYAWISSNISESSSVLEIGCGNGNSTMSFLSRGCKVVCVEINDTLITMAEENITNAGYKVERIDITQISNIDLSSETDCYLIHASVFDSGVSLLALGFDYIMFSFFGAAPLHAANELEQEVENLDIDFAKQYREKATLRALELKIINGDQCKLCVVDRIQQLQGHSKFEIRNAYADDLSTRLAIPINQITVKTKVNTAMQKTTSSAMQYIHDGSMNSSRVTPLIALAII